MDNQVDFMGIGAARAGTTWLWTILNRHPEIWTPPIKELHYFDRSPDYPSPSILSDDRPIHRLFGMEKHNAAFRVLFLRSLGSSILFPRRWKELGWKLKYFLGTYDDNWYLSLFNTRKQVKKGEVTPSYSILSREDVQHVRTLFPGLKIIYLIRNPTERAWSALRYRWTKKTLDIDDLEEVIRTINHPSQSFRSDYVRTIQNWSSCYPREQILICFFDDILKQPQQLITKVLHFLNVDPKLPVPVAELNVKVNASTQRQIPAAIQSYLAQKYYPEVKKLVPLVGGYSEVWLKDIEAKL